MSTSTDRAPNALRRLLRLGAGGPPSARQSLVTVLWLLGMVWTTAVRTGHWQWPDTSLWICLIGAWVPLLIRTFRPVVAIVGTVLAESTILIFLPVPPAIADLHGGMGAYQPAPLATMLAVATFAAAAPRAAGWVAGLVAGAWLAVIGVTLDNDGTWLPDLLVFYLVVTAAAAGVWRAGRRERAARELAEREEHAHQAVLDERLRIARELHDVLAHHLTLVNAQAGVARYLLRQDRDAAEQALGDIETHTGRALDELRATIGLLRSRGASDDDPDDVTSTRRPVPGLAALDALVADLATAGADVAVRVAGERVELHEHADLAAYRIVQESLTNATKHAPGAPIEVTITWTEEGVRLRILNPVEPGRPPGPGTRNGLIGMRERAVAAGGTFRAGPTGDRRFEVVAALPARGTAHPIHAVL